MTDKNMLLSNLSHIHTTPLGIERIKKNLKSDCDDVVEYCKKKISDDNCTIYKSGKNFYCENDNIIITVNSHSFTIITAHIKN